MSDFAETPKPEQGATPAPNAAPYASIGEQPVADPKPASIVPPHEALGVSGPQIPAAEIPTPIITPSETHEAPGTPTAAPKDPIRLDAWRTEENAIKDASASTPDIKPAEPIASESPTVAPEVASPVSPTEPVTPVPEPDSFSGLTKQSETSASEKTAEVAPPATGQTKDTSTSFVQAPSVTEMSGSTPSGQENVPPVSSGAEAIHTPIPTGPVTAEGVVSAPPSQVGEANSAFSAPSQDIPGAPVAPKTAVSETPSTLPAQQKGPGFVGKVLSFIPGFGKKAA